MPNRLTSDQGGHYGNRPIKADEGTNGDSRLREYGSHLLANVLRRPRICMRESFLQIFQHKTIRSYSNFAYLFVTLTLLFDLIF
jgi:hypothetical protein